MFVIKKEQPNKSVLSGKQHDNKKMANKKPANKKTLK
jgi:hypothetical protein